MIKIGIVGYGNLARGAECGIYHAPDMKLEAIFTRRDPSSIHPVNKDVPVRPIDEILDWKDKIDVLLLCGGSATDLPSMTPALAKHFHVIDSFDTHAKIPQHFEAVHQSATEGNRVAIISAGWDPGLFSLARVYATAVLSGSPVYTFWGKGVSQGHSDAVRRIPGVADCRQYTIPIEKAMDAVRNELSPVLSTREKHSRHCFVVPEAGADLHRIEDEIKSMPNYFADYDTTVTFVTQEELDRDHKELPHGGHVICAGNTGWAAEHRQRIEFSLNLDSNPEFTSSVLLACARATVRMASRNQTGCYTILDIPPVDLSPYSREELLSQFL